MASWLTFFGSVTVVSFIAISGFTLACVAGFLFVVKRTVQAGVHGAIESFTKSLAEHEGRLKEHGDTLDRFGARLSDVEKDTRAAHRRLDDLIRPKVTM